MNKKIILYFISLLTCYITYAQQNEAPAWVDFAEKKLTNNLADATLNDYSYSGYHFSEKEIPNVSSWSTISVLDYGAIANDTGYDDAGIQAAINAAQATGLPTVVFFPAGRYVVSSEATKSTPIVISKSNIVLKGEGSGFGGTEIYTDKFQDVDFLHRFQFVPTDIRSIDITNVTSEIKKGDFEIEVVSTERLSVGQSVDLYQRNPNNLEANMPGLTPNVNWGAIKNNGIRPYEKHIIAGISGNKVTFKNPIQLNMPANGSTVLKTHNTIEEVGVEDILFTSGWKDYPETFLHHANAIVDSAWKALQFESVENGWIRNCHFKDWNEVIEINRSIAVTVKDITISGKRGHAGYYSRYSYGVLFENCLDNVSEGLSSDNRKGMLHGPGMRWSTTSSVFINCTMPLDQSIDCHGYHPYANLLDNVNGGKLSGNGGAENAYPNSGPYLTFWNFKHDGDFRNRAYNFWFISGGSSRKTETFAYPNFVGFQSGAGENITFKNEGLDELRDEQVYPNSLFDAQLQLRLYGSYMSASSSKTSTKAKLANDGNDVTYWESNGNGTGEWLMLDLGVSKNVSEIIIKEQTSRIKDWQLEYWDDSQWKELKTDSGIGVEKQISFGAINTRKIRFNILNMLSGQEQNAVMISEFEVKTSSQLPLNNFTIETTGETCKGKGNGKITINAAVARKYIASINGMDYDFIQDKIIKNLAPGTYNLSISLEGDSHKQYYELTIEGSVDLIGKIAVHNNVAKVIINQGTVPYSVYKNGEQVMETYLSNFSVNVNQGDDLQIKSKDACQGEILKTINLNENVQVYPNPSNGSFDVYMSNDLKVVDVSVYNAQMQIVYNKSVGVNNGKFSIDISNRTNGVYFVKVNSVKPVFVKLIKK